MLAKLPDPVLVRLFREGTLPTVKQVTATRSRITVKFAGGTQSSFVRLGDFGWIADLAA